MPTYGIVSSILSLGTTHIEAEENIKNDYINDKLASGGECDIFDNYVTM